MIRVPVIVIFDIGKTNKKVLVFDEAYQVVWAQETGIPPLLDSDGDPCENLEALTAFVRDTFSCILQLPQFRVKAVNFAAYGAALVWLDAAGQPLCPVYDYLKPYPEELLEEFYLQYGGAEAMALRTASPVLGSLNTGLQCYRIKKEQPGLYRRARYILHLPHYLSYLFSGVPVTGLTSLGCHTQLWDFTTQAYAHWVKAAGIHLKLPALVSSNAVFPMDTPAGSCLSGTGIHDSSAALIPYLLGFSEPFILLSTGTWSISLNPFQPSALRPEELQQDCLCYLQYQGRPVKASRVFAGQAYAQGISRLAEQFQCSPDFFHQLPYNAALVSCLQAGGQGADASPELAYHRLMLGMALQQERATRLISGGTAAKKLFVDGGFSKNQVYLQLLAQLFPEMEVYAAAAPQATAQGAAMVLHAHWNSRPLPVHPVSLKYYPCSPSF